MPVIDSPVTSAWPDDSTVTWAVCAAVIEVFPREMNRPVMFPLAVALISPPMTPAAPKSILPTYPGKPSDGLVPAVSVILGPAVKLWFKAICRIPPRLDRISPRGVSMVISPGIRALPGVKLSYGVEARMPLP